MSRIISTSSWLEGASLEMTCSSVLAELNVRIRTEIAPGSAVFGLTSSPWFSQEGQQVQFESESFLRNLETGKRLRRAGE